MIPTGEQKEFNIICQYATHHLRDTADGDYIMSRAAYRLELIQQFLWIGHQAVEKYLKAILLFNGYSAIPNQKKYGHNIEYFLQRVRTMQNLPVDIPDKVDAFVLHLNEAGMTRYQDTPTQSRANDLVRLDECVWHLRRFCQTLNDPTDHSPNADQRKMQLIALNSFAKWGKRPCKYNLYSGYIEAILRRSGSAREHLVWKNAFYGTRNKKVIKCYPGIARFTNSVPCVYRESLEILEKVVCIPGSIKNYLVAHPPDHSIHDT